MPKSHTTSTRRSYTRPMRSRTIRSRYSKTGRRFLYLALAGLLVGLLGACVLSNITSRLRAAFYMVGDYSVVGKPTISVQLINEVLDRNHSPARGKGQALYDYGVRYNIDPAYALAFFMHESSFGTAGVAKVTHSLGNIRSSAGYPDYHGYRLYSTWEAGFEDWYKLISQQYVGTWGLYTVDQIIPVYAPAADNNDEAAYIQSIKNAVDAWRSGSTVV